MKIRIILILLTLGLLYSCQQNITSQNPEIKEGMIKVSILYPNGDGKTFDMDYYSQKHMPMAADLFGEDLKAMVIDKGLAGGAPDSAPTYKAVGYFYFDSMATFQSAMGTHSDKLRADVPNYTNIQPVIQVSEVQMTQ